MYCSLQVCQYLEKQTLNELLPLVSSKITTQILGKKVHRIFFDQKLISKKPKNVKTSVYMVPDSVCVSPSFDLSFNSAKTRT